MKNVKLISFIFLVFASISFVSCDNEPIDSMIDLDDFGGNNNNPGEAVFKADFSGSTWVADDVLIYLTGNTIKLVATRGAENESFAFLLDDNVEGNYPANQNVVAFTPANSEFGYWSINPDDENENTGSVTITNINTTTQTMSGFFNFKGYWSNDLVNNILPILFTNGIFQDVPYVTQSPTDDTFYAKVNGTEFVDTDITAILFTVDDVDLITINASNSVDDKITIGINDGLGVGSYPITTTSTNQTQARYIKNGTTYTAQSGIITVTSKTLDRIKGTFSFTTDGAAPFTMTEGQFDVAY